MAEPTDEELTAALLQVTSDAVCGYIGIRWGWGIVTLEYRDSRARAYQRALERLPLVSQQIISLELKRGGWNDRSAKSLRRLSTLTRRQQEARTTSILDMSMRCMAHEEWLQ